jgi:hypothetical protein
LAAVDPLRCTIAAEKIFGGRLAKPDARRKIKLAMAAADVNRQLRKTRRAKNCLRNVLRFSPQISRVVDNLFCIIVVSTLACTLLQLLYALAASAPVKFS